MTILSANGYDHPESLDGEFISNTGKGEHPYPANILDLALRSLARACDCGVQGYRHSPDVWFGIFALSPIASSFAKGEPFYLGGKYFGEGMASYLEKLIRGHGRMKSFYDDASWRPDSPSFWLGENVALLQWFVNLPFPKIFENLPVLEILKYSENVRKAECSRLDFLKICDGILEQRLDGQTMPDWDELLGLK